MKDEAILIVDGTGTVVEGNAAAQRRFGNVRGRRCAEVVCVREKGITRCNQSCVTELHRAGVTDEKRGTVRTRHCIVRCSPVQDHVVVTIADGAIEEKDVEALSHRELQVLRLVSEGLTTQSTADQLGVKYSTVRTHVENIRRKLRAGTRAEAVARALALGWLDG